ncbi:hypothetical protein THASP1DRAFT_18681 [Thamnocephalis sphaerospora]|uniref:Uncharacterized protein n=1 Tax=Thamnocephalis sphaerospora TaxID=78915 RepID=A0A4V1IW44_9FUNG|nr:hypothetical protein THASP1DRAFT_18681 [Thamnocephalis sphaerospora]|eukprot:RKP06269.1 hypothetical protein THASP1DRAFT_18681 [Thamnocephalis sphaerospora]
MAEQYAKQSQYQYAANSNLVLDQDRSRIPRRDNEPTGEPETLYGRINPKEMGGKAIRERLPVTDEKKQRAQERRELEKLRRHGRKDDSARAGRAFNSVLSATEDMEGLMYTPRTKDTRDAYELILAFVHDYLPDQSHETIRSAADVILETLKADGVKDYDKKAEVDKLFSQKMDSERFAQLVSLGKKITDYGDGQAADGAGLDERMEAIDDEHGMAVVFEDQDEEDADLGLGDADEAEYEMHNSESESESEAEAELQEDADAAASVLRVRTAQHGDIPAHEIDAFWLQRLVSSHYSDVHVAQGKTTEAMRLLADDALTTRDRENELMQLFDYDKFELVQVLTRNRDLIVWCTKLVRAGADGPERQAVEAEIRRRQLDWILRELQGDAAAKQDEGTGMDVDKSDEQAAAAAAAAAAPETAPKAEGTAPQRQLDLESLAFQEGGHLMSNKRCKLPEGSFKRVKKGYEEIHVPAPKAKPFSANERLVPIADMPEWARVAFAGTKKLNRVQSRVFPVAFGEDENMLLCAPTGAGKVSTVCRAEWQSGL